MPAPALVENYDFIGGPLAKAGSEDLALAECPRCEKRMWLGKNQYKGEVSIQCPTPACSYHETHDLRTVTF